MKIINHEVNGLEISQRHDDGYMNLTQMAKVNNKLIADYLRLDTTKALLDKLSTVMGIPISGKNGLIQIRKGGNDKNAQGTWGHPKVAIHCAIWCDTEFAVLVIDLIFEWMISGQNPISSQSMGIPADISSIVEELENLIISIRSHSRTIHTGSHQPVDPILFKSLHAVSHNQLSVINAAIQHLELLKSIAEMNAQDEPTPPFIQQRIDYPDNSPTPIKLLEPKTKETKTTQLTKINIKISSRQREWLAAIASTIRQNNTKPVPPSKRVYPQHLISVAIEYLQTSTIDLESVRSIFAERDSQRVSINIKLDRELQEWLTDTAQTIRDSMGQPTLPEERIYPQHLIGVAIEKLSAANVDWNLVQNIEELRKQLNL
jgi:KilA-N domain